MWLVLLTFRSFGATLDPTECSPNFQLAFPTQQKQWAAVCSVTVVPKVSRTLMCIGKRGMELALEPFCKQERDGPRP